MLCLSHKGTADLIKQLIKGYDSQVSQWKDKLEPVIPVRCKFMHHLCIKLYIADGTIVL